MRVDMLHPTHPSFFLFNFYNIVIKKETVMISSGYCHYHILAPILVKSWPFPHYKLQIKWRRLGEIKLAYVRVPSFGSSGVIIFMDNYVLLPNCALAS